ncbi:tyrosine-type recombinase/integrase [Clostridium sp. MSJ-11]|uniref:Tyrosine-type recombinase/integrase n=1 Tax=Clostridium mobile TaxID=2841512 RepID=A0ABS6ENC8_9CLOT|nr:tyrosine-type recombinase/integrase [Clostridium mobile]MBU5486553.1 tyrosine-type recombinase/integrase [Clostridium mobile]
MINLVKKDGVIKAQEVEPLKNIKDINKIKIYFRGKEDKRDYIIFVVGINIGLRASDLLQLKLKDVLNLDESIKDSVMIQEQKTRKIREFKLNKSCKEALEPYIKDLNNADMEDYLFPSRKGGHLTVKSLHKIIKSITRELNIKGNYGTHTLRKTFAYHIYTNNIQDNSTILHTLQKILNHSTPSMTLRYIGITKEVINDVYDGLNL